MKWFPTVDFWVIFWPCNFRYRWPICLLKFITHIGFARSMHSRLQYKYLNLKLAFSYNWSHPQHPVTRETTSTIHCWLVHIDALASHLELQGVLILTSVTHYTCANGSNCRLMLWEHWKPLFTASTSVPPLTHPSGCAFTWSQKAMMNSQSSYLFLGLVAFSAIGHNKTVKHQYLVIALISPPKYYIVLE